MGKGDKKSKRGKIVLGTYGARRHKKDAHKLMPVASASKVETVVTEPELKVAEPKRKTKTPASH